MAMNTLCSPAKTSFFHLSHAEENPGNRPEHFPQPRKPSKIIRDTFRSRGNRQKSFGTFSAAAETFKNRPGHFPQPRKPSKIIRDVFRSRGNLLEYAFFPQAESFIDIIHEKILPLKGHVPTYNFTPAEQVRRARAGI
jgi:hypothetical protein